MYQIGKNSDIKLRLNEINRMSVELSMASSVLANLAAQLNALRKVNEMAGACANRQPYTNRHLSQKHLGTSRL